MNKDKRLRELYNATFQEIHASDELKGMVEDMANQKKIIWRNVWKKSIAAAAATQPMILPVLDFFGVSGTGETFVCSLATSGCFLFNVTEDPSTAAGVSSCAVLVFIVTLCLIETIIMSYK